jgi:hypothetical protein
MFIKYNQSKSELQDNLLSFTNNKAPNLKPGSLIFIFKVNPYFIHITILILIQILKVKICQN